jgi:hypothetical protein
VEGPDGERERWRVSTVETSAGIYRVTIEDPTGRRAVATGTDPDALEVDLRSWAQHIDVDCGRPPV